MPALGAGADLPEAEVARGESWLWVKPLPDDKVKAVRDAFYRRNFDAMNIRQNPHTGYVEYAELRSAPSEPPLIAWAGEELERRRLTPYWRNADLMGITERELRGLVWTWPHDLCTEGHGRRSRPEFAHMGPFAGKFKLRACFDKQGTVRTIELAVWGPPVPMDTVPSLSEEDALAALERQGEVIEHRFYLSVTSVRLASGRPKLVLHGDGYLEWRGEPELIGKSRRNGEPQLATWRIAWRIPISRGIWDTYVDAKNGDLFDVIKVLYR